MIKVRKRYKRVSVLFFLIIFNFWGLPLFAQTAEHLYALATDQCSQGNYEQSIKNLKRVQFFDEETRFPDVFQKLGDCYFHLSDFGSAFYYYDLAIIQNENDSVSNYCLSRKVACKLYNKEYNEALVELMSLDSEPIPSFRKDFDMLFGITYYYLGDFMMAQRYFTSVCLSSLHCSADSINYFLDHTNQLKKRFKPGTAKIMSMFIPGSGQIYAGDWKNGLNSFFLTTGFLAVGTALGGSLSFIDAAVIVLPWFQRYYTGGFQKAYSITSDRLANEMNENLLDLIRYMEKNNNPG